MPYPTYPCSPTNNERTWSPLSHSTSYEHNNKQINEQPKKDKSQNGSPVKLVSTSSIPANMLLADLANPWREMDTVDAVPQRNRHKRHQSIELTETPSKLKILSDSAYKLNDAGSQSTFYPERDLPDRLPWSYKRNRGEDSIKLKVKFEDFDNDGILPSVSGPNYKLHFPDDDGDRRIGGVAVRRNVPTKQFINNTNSRVSDSDGSKCFYNSLGFMKRKKNECGHWYLLLILIILIMGLV